MKKRKVGQRESLIKAVRNISKVKHRRFCITVFDRKHKQEWTDYADIIDITLTNNPD